MFKYKAECKLENQKQTRLYSVVFIMESLNNLKTNFGLTLPFKQANCWTPSPSFIPPPLMNPFVDLV